VLLLVVLRCAGAALAAAPHGGGGDATWGPDSRAAVGGETAETKHHCRHIMSAVRRSQYGSLAGVDGELDFVLPLLSWACRFYAVFDLRLVAMRSRLRVFVLTAGSSR
jgi:hypothetical protein